MRGIIRPARHWFVPRAWKCLSTIIFASALLGSLATPAQAQELQDVVYLKNGSVIRGTIVEQVPGESILIQTVDGNRFRYPMEDIERLTKEPAPGGGTQPVTQVVLRTTKSPGTAWALSFLLPGVGQFYNGDGGDGALFLVLHVLLSAALASELECTGRDCDESKAGLAALGLLGNWVVAQVDAFKDAKRINAGLPPQLPEEDLGLGFSLAPNITPRRFNTPFGDRLTLDVQVARWVF